MTTHKFKIVELDQGFCRLIYKTLNKNNQTVYYCLQQDHDGANLYRFIEEPEYKVCLPLPAKELLEMPKGDSALEKLFINWILNN